jgi:hypothetical protein
VATVGVADATAGVASVVVVAHELN